MKNLTADFGSSAVLGVALDPPFSAARAGDLRAGLAATTLVCRPRAGLFERERVEIGMLLLQSLPEYG